LLFNIIIANQIILLENICDTNVLFANTIKMDLCHLWTKRFNYWIGLDWIE